MDIITNICAVVNDEATALKQVEASIRHNNEDYLELVKQIIALNGRLIFTGVGKSGHIGRKLAATFASMGTPAFFVHA